MITQDQLHDGAKFKNEKTGNVFILEQLNTSKRWFLIRKDCLFIWMGGFTSEPIDAFFGYENIFTYIES